MPLYNVHILNIAIYAPTPAEAVDLAIHELQSRGTDAFVYSVTTRDNILSADDDFGDYEIDAGKAVPL